jgi:DUF4097 and DUF4098 domain-containing protein YvlB
MTTVQKVIKYLAIAFAIFLTVSIIGGILSAVGLFGGLFSSDAVLEEVKTYSVEDEIHNLDIEINAADLCIKEGEAFSVESNLKHLKVEENGGLLTIQETKKFTGTYSGAVLTVYVPAGTVFDNVSLTAGAGRLTIGNLSSGTLDFELGAGDVSIDSLIATESTDIEGGAGRITITNGALKDLDLDMGVGQLNLTSALTGNCQLDLGVGESNITLIGSKEDYKLDLEKGLGNISVDGKNVSDYGSSGNGKNKVEIHGGIGAINVEFKDAGEL